MKGVLLTLCIALSVPAQAKNSRVVFIPPELTATVASQYAVHSMMASNAYHKADRVRFPLEKLGWIQVDVKGKPTTKPTEDMRSGLAYDIFEKQNSNEVVFAFRGTDSKRDYARANLAIWPFSGQYKQARNAFKEYMVRHPEKKVMVTGHSLGGGLALCMSLRFGVDAVVFDSSPRVFDGFGDKHKPANRIMIYEAGEVLEVIRKLWKKKFNSVVLQTNIYKASFDFHGINKHRSDYLALGLLDRGATVDPNLVPVKDALPK